MSEANAKPIWERVLSEIAALRAEMQTGFEKLRVEMDYGFRKTADQIDVLNRSVLEVRADLRYFDRRIAKLESDISARRAARKEHELYERRGR